MCALFSYRKEKLLAFFSTYSKTENSEKKTPLNLSFLQLIIIHVPEIFCWLVFVFLRLVVAIQICSNGEEYEHYILKNVSISISSWIYIRSLILPDPLVYKQWCFLCVTPAREFTDHIMMAALARALEVPLRLERLHGVGSDEDNIYTGPGDVSVTLLYTGNHYDIIYPRPVLVEHPAD
jgi:hypothetical protein